MVVQSTELSDGTTQQQRQQNLVFSDAGLAQKHITPMVSFKPDCDVSGSLGDYLSRPVAINTFSWVEGSTATSQNFFAPWALYFNTPAIKNKLANYTRIRAKLHLKFVINASPFYYGALRACYCPYNLGSRDNTLSIGDQIKFSQMPGDFMYPQDMTSMEMELPFLWPHAWLSLGSLGNFTQMGRMNYYLYSQLRSANGGTGQNVTITCYAWAEDVELAGLTSGLSLQGDEYDSAGVISGPATAIANVASKLTDAPIIGSLARATEIGARTIGGIASLFGYSNPPVIDDVHGFVPKAFHSFASVETGMPMDKLTIDPKNEITVDKTVTGASANDDLTVSSFCGRRSFITGSLWTDAYAPGTQIMAFPVTPRMYASNPGTLQNFINETPAAHASSLFQFWRGEMVYTLRFVKTRYHTGRVQVSWDPQGTPGTNAETTTITRIVDLQMETEVTFSVPFKAHDPWLSVDNDPNTWAITTGGTVTNLPLSYNGIVRVTVLNELTGPANTQQIDVLLFVNAGDGFQLAVPSELPSWSSLPVQSSEDDGAPLADIASTPVQPDVNAVTVGETIASLRTLLHRTSFYHREFLGNPFSAPSTFNTRAMYNLVNYVPRFPTDYGYNSAGVNYAVGQVAVAKDQFQFSPNHPLNWLGNCFVGYRGGIVHQYNVIPNGFGLPDEFKAERDPRSWLLDGWPRQAINRFSVSTSASGASTISRVPITSTFSVKRDTLGQRGMAITNTNTQSALSVVVPYYSKWKFRPAYVNTRDDINGVNELESVKVVASMRCGAVSSAVDEGWPILSIYMAGASDFDLIFFVCVPTLYDFSTPTVDDSY